MLVCRQNDEKQCCDVHNASLSRLFWLMAVSQNNEYNQAKWHQSIIWHLFVDKLRSQFQGLGAIFRDHATTSPSSNHCELKSNKYSFANSNTEPLSRGVSLSKSCKWSSLLTTSCVVLQLTAFYAEKLIDELPKPNMNSMKLVILLHFISWKNSFSDISRKRILPNLMGQLLPKSYLKLCTSC